MSQKYIVTKKEDFKNIIYQRMLYRTNAITSLTTMIENINYYSLEFLLNNGNYSDGELFEKIDEFMGYYMNGFSMKFDNNKSILINSPIGIEFIGKEIVSPVSDMLLDAHLQGKKFQQCFRGTKTHPFMWKQSDSSLTNHFFDMLTFKDTLEAIIKENLNENLNFIIFTLLLNSSEINDKETEQLFNKYKQQWIFLTKIKSNRRALLEKRNLYKNKTIGDGGDGKYRLYSDSFLSSSKESANELVKIGYEFKNFDITKDETFLDENFYTFIDRIYKRKFEENVKTNYFLQNIGYKQKLDLDLVIGQRINDLERPKVNENINYFNTFDESMNKYLVVNVKPKTSKEIKEEYLKNRNDIDKFKDDMMEKFEKESTSKFLKKKISDIEKEPAIEYLRGLEDKDLYEKEKKRLRIEDIDFVTYDLYEQNKEKLVEKVEVQPIKSKFLSEKEFDKIILDDKNKKVESEKKNSSGGILNSFNSCYKYIKGIM